MSLDVYLLEDVCPCCGVGNEVYSANITHNLGQMANEAGIYYALWRPEEKGYKLAKDIFPILESGLVKMKENPSHYKQFDSPNGWGTYGNFIQFVEDYLSNCREHPDSTIKVSR